MAYVHYDRISAVTATSGTGNLVVSGSLPGARPWSTLANGEQFVYCLEEGTNYEIADGTWNSGTGTITRGTLHSSTTGAKLNLSGSGATVMLIVSSKWIREVQDVLASWGVNLSGHLVPATHASRDIGTSLIRPRDLYLSRHADIAGNVTVGGSLNVAGVSVVSELLGLNSWLFDNTLDIAALQASVSAGKAGLRISRGSTTQINIAAGRIHNHNITKSIVFPTATTLDLTNSGHFVNGASRATTTWYHVLVGHLTSDGSAVAGLSTTLAKPAAWSDWQMIGAWPTTGAGSGDWFDAVQTGNRFSANSENTVYSNTSPGAAEKAVRAWCPPMECEVILQLRLYGPSAADYAAFRRSAGGGVVIAPRFSTGREVNMEFAIVTDASGNVYHYQLGGTTFSEFLIHGRSFVYPIGEAGAY